MSTGNKTLGNRMKEYEYVTRTYLTRRMPAIIRVDMKAGHTFTRGLKKPWDEIFTSCMDITALRMCQNIQGAKCAYVQSDEISILLTDYDNINTDAWFNKNILKMTSVSASMATLYFNRMWENMCDEYAHEFAEAWNVSKEDTEYLDVLDSKRLRAMFDSRVFVLPKEEVCNYFIWRQQDAIRNSIQSVGQANFSHKELQNLSCDQIQDKLFLEKGINWNDFQIKYKRGVFIYKKNGENDWKIDENMPILTQYVDYINRFVYIEED